MKRSLSSKTGT